MEINFNFRLECFKTDIFVEAFKYWQKKVHSCGSDWWTDFSRVLSSCCGNAHRKHQAQDKSSSKDTQLKSVYCLFGWKMPQLCISSHQQVSCDYVYVRTSGTVEAAVLFSSSLLEKLPGRCVIIPSPCLVPAAEWSFLYSREARAPKMGLPFSSLPVEKRLGTAGGVCSFPSQDLVLWVLAWLWLLLGSSLLGVTVLQSEQTLALACWMFCLVGLRSMTRKSSSDNWGGGKMHTATFTLALSKMPGTCVSWLMIERKWEGLDLKNQTKKPPNKPTKTNKN